MPTQDVRRPGDRLQPDHRTPSRPSRERHKPVRKPNTIAKSLAIGDPADGYFAAKLIRETGGWAEDVTDDEIVEAMTLLAETEGIFAETAGGVTVAVARKLIEQGRIDRDEEIVLCITGNGLKTQDAVIGNDRPAGRHQADPGRVRGARGRAGSGRAGRRRGVSLARHAAEPAHDPPIAAMTRRGRAEFAPDGYPEGHRIDGRRQHPHPAPSPHRRPRPGRRPGATVGEVLADLGTRYPEFHERIFDGRASCSGSSTSTSTTKTSASWTTWPPRSPAQDEISIIPAVAGG